LKTPNLPGCGKTAVILGRNPKSEPAWEHKKPFNDEDIIRLIFPT